MFEWLRRRNNLPKFVSVLSFIDIGCDALRCAAMRCDAMRCDALRCTALTQKRQQAFHLRDLQFLSDKPQPLQHHIVTHELTVAQLGRLSGPCEERDISGLFILLFLLHFGPTHNAISFPLSMQQ